MEHRVDICVVGAGPAGCALAIQLSRLGHDVLLVERDRFPRRRLGESLTPGVVPMLQSIGAHQALEIAGFRRVHRVQATWDRGPQTREDPEGRGLVVDRASFDHELLRHARTLGVKVRQPAGVRNRRWHRDAWSLEVEAATGSERWRARYLADATGRRGWLPGRRRRTGCPTLAVHAYWRGGGGLEEPRIEAGAEAWYWGVPLPDGTWNTLLFVDPARFRAGGSRPLPARFREWLDRSGLMAGNPDAGMDGPVHATDATPHLDEASVTLRSIKVGDAALALDPLSSSGVQKALQSALSGAIVVNTLLRKPASQEAALRFHQDGLAAASDRHRAWAAGHYQAVAEHGGGPFWQARAADADPSRAADGGTPPDPRRHPPGEDDPLVLSPDLRFEEVPCLEGDFVCVRAAIRHPRLDGPVAYLGGWELAPLVRRIPPVVTSRQVARALADALPAESARAVADWLLERGLLQPAAASTDA